MLDNSDKFDFIPLPENINFNENSNVVIEIKLTKKEKNYLNHKRKRAEKCSNRRYNTLQYKILKINALHS